MAKAIRLLRKVSEMLSRLLGRASPQIQFSQATSWHHLSDCAELVVNQFAKSGYVDDTPQERLRVLKNYLDDRFTVTMATVGKRVVATITVVADSREEGLPIDEVFPEAQAYRENGGRSQITYLAAERGVFGKLAYEPIMSCAMLQILASESRHAVMTINPKHRRRYRKLCGFQYIVEIPREHPGFKGNPAIAMVFNMDDAQRYPYISENLLRYAHLLEG